MIRRKKKPIFVDHGPLERLQHAVYEKIETTTAGVKAVRNITIDPITTYVRRNTITQSQFVAAEYFAGQYRKAALVAAYSHVRFGHTPGGQSDEFLEQVNDTKKKVRAALKFVGQPLASVIEHVVGNDQPAGTWSGVKNSKRSTQDGMVALRLGLDGLIIFYKIR